MDLHKEYWYDTSYLARLKRTSLLGIYIDTTYCMALVQHLQTAHHHGKKIPGRHRIKTYVFCVQSIGDGEENILLCCSYLFIPAWRRVAVQRAAGEGGYIYYPRHDDTYERTSMRAQERARSSSCNVVDPTRAIVNMACMCYVL